VQILFTISSLFSAKRLYANEPDLATVEFVRGRCVDPVQSAKSAAVRRDYRAQGLSNSVLADYQAERRTTLGNPIDVGDQSPDFLGTSDLDKVLA
jgi:hypothetical protein